MTSQRIIVLTAVVVCGVLAFEAWPGSAAPVSIAKATKVAGDGKNTTKQQQDTASSLSSTDRANSNQSQTPVQAAGTKQNSPTAAVQPSTAETAPQSPLEGSSSSKKPAVDDSALQYDDVKAAAAGEAAGEGADAPPTYDDDIDMLLSSPAVMSRAFEASTDDVTGNDVSDDDEDDDAAAAALQQLFTTNARQVPVANDVDLSPTAMAEYLMMTGDFRGLQQAINDLVGAGLLSEADADSYSDTVGVEYLTLVQQQQNNLPRQQRDIYRLQQQDTEELDTSLPYDIAAARDYVEYGNGVLQPLAETDGISDDYTERFEPLRALPAVDVDQRFLEELLRQTPSDEQRDDGEEAMDEEEERAEANGRQLQNELEQLQKPAAESYQPVGLYEEAPVASVDDVAADDSKGSLEAELESLPAANVAAEDNDRKLEVEGKEQQREETETGDDEERELETVGQASAAATGEKTEQAGDDKDKRQKP